MKKSILAMTVMAAAWSMSAAQQTQTEQRLVAEAYDTFNPHFTLGVQAGAAYSLGEGDFGESISPAAQITLGYKFSPLFGARFSVSGWQAKNTYVYPRVKYKWNYVQPSVDFMVDLSALFAGWNPSRAFSSYAFVGVGAPIGFGNDDANNAVFKGKPLYFENRWDGTKVFWAARAGLGAAYNVSSRVSIGLELNAEMISDKFNSKKGKDNGPDWQFNLLAGVKIALGSKAKHVEAVYETVETVTETPAPAPVVEQPATPAPAQTQPATATVKPLDIDVFFTINRSNIRKSETEQLDRLVKYMKEYPQSTVTLTGYADRETGTPAVNMRLSKERAQSVKAYLVERGIEGARIFTDAKGDTVQPFDTAPQNRVTIAITNPK